MLIAQNHEKTENLEKEYVFYIAIPFVTSWVGAQF